MLKNIYIYSLIISCLGVNAQAQNPDFKHVDSKSFANLMANQKGTLLDVRTSSEFKNGHIEGSGQLNYYAFDFSQKLLLLPKDEPIYLYCNTGYRSKRAAEILTKNGYTKVYNLKHGIMEWNLSNFPVIVEKDAKPDTENRMEPDEYFALINSEKPVFIDFYAPWCAPCRAMMPMIDSLQKEYKHKIHIVKINADASKKLVKQLQINSVPYFAFYKKGVKIHQHIGVVERNKLENLFEEHLTGQM